ncbi:DUF3011 domain-containing protein [Sandarakinorhabdus oryzae]|uniref:DUF3011 domain-containing protein n=1 Tax=Sandarakinorhabdus oryzae TaxID=2675220 RepID=UPI0012E1D693|nr:DUF3011 domain-containing protein [Sandarakinorhabdus oryzae]
MQRSAGLFAMFAMAMAALAPPVAAQSNWNNGGWNGGWNDGWNNGGRGAIVRCESWNYRYARCRADTSGGVRLGRVLGGNCRGGNWGTGRNYIWVNNGCRADFEVSRYGGGGGGSTGAVIAGAAVAAGLLALLLSKGKKKEAEAATQGSARPPATIDIAPNQVPPAAEKAFRQCIDEAARQVGATGGTSLRLTAEVQHRPQPADQIGNQAGGWEFRLPLEATWDGKPQPTPAECSATDSAVQKLDFLPEPGKP